MKQMTMKQFFILIAFFVFYTVQSVGKTNPNDGNFMGNSGTVKDTITVDNLLNIAVKYFSINKINDDGYYVGKVCDGQNLLNKTETERNPSVEEFCVSSIVKHYQSEEFSMYDEFVKAIKELYKVNLGIDKNERLLRAQGAMFLLMRNNENLKNMLLKEYERNKDNLPFVLK